MNTNLTTIKTSNKKSSEFARKKQPFKASNLNGEILFNKDHNKYYYFIYSFKWYPLFVFDFDLNRWYENKDKYSVSTTRQASNVRPIFTPSTMPKEMFEMFKNYNF